MGGFGINNINNLHTFTIRIRLRVVGSRMWGKPPMHTNSTTAFARGGVEHSMLEIQLLEEDALNS